MELLLARHRPKKVIIFSRDELKQHEMRQRFPEGRPSPVRYFIGDVRDHDRLRRAMHGVTTVIHAAALKQVPVCEYNPIEAVKTNVLGAANVIEAAIDAGVKKVLAISTDKAVNPVNLYGATKLVAEKLFVQANSYSGKDGTKFACVRYGNVVGSRGSVIPLFAEQRKTGKVTVTDKRMTRFWITLEQGTRFVAKNVERMHGGEIFVPKIPSMNIMDLVKAIAPGCKTEIIGVRPGEKIHEVLVSEDEARSSVDIGDAYVVKPAHSWWDVSHWLEGKPVGEGFRYSSDSNKKWLTVKDLQALVREHEQAGKAGG
ncbi:MAG TPA: UDP-N-acetylglucosamine 4,6-dehydratase (inverting) [Thermoplasmata archaeon]|nr:UDP-N-acetylglucosamine 4,6-dehydratase (inverting) [Thermoplasmata archaeon]